MDNTQTKAGAVAATQTPKPGTVTHPLEYPFEYKGARVASITLRRASKKDISRANAIAKGNDDIFQTHILANLGEVEPAFFDDMDASDYFALSKLLEGFLSSKKETPAQ